MGRASAKRNQIAPVELIQQGILNCPWVVIRRNLQLGLTVRDAMTPGDPVEIRIDRASDRRIAVCLRINEISSWILCVGHTPSPC